MNSIKKLYVNEDTDILIKLNNLRREKALNYLGTKYILHPINRVQRNEQTNRHWKL